MPTVLHNMTIREWLTGALLAALVLVSLFLAESIFTPQHAAAQSITGTISQPSSCVIFNSNFGYGAYDYSSGNAVSALQNYLVNQGYFNSAYLGTGHYGAITLRSVAQFQAAHGISATGFVGPLTRAMIQNISCGTNPTPTPLPTSAVSLYSESPTSGVVGTTVTLTGSGFTNSNTVLMDGNVAASNVSATSFATPVACNPFAASCTGGAQQTVTFTIPSALAPYCTPGFACPQYMRLLTPAQYQITVLNSNGTSNAITFTVTSGTTDGQQLSISGLDAPASLALGTTGTWTVHALSSGQGNLHYSVVWGDEAAVYSNGIAASPTTNTQSSATFTHAYSRSGTFTPTFTVSDDFGHSVSTSNTVVVTPLY